LRHSALAHEERAHHRQSGLNRAAPSPGWGGRRGRTGGLRGPLRRPDDRDQSRCRPLPGPDDSQMGRVSCHITRPATSGDECVRSPEGPPTLSPEALSALGTVPADPALERGVAHLLRLEQDNGCWEGEMVWCTMILSQYV